MSFKTVLFCESFNRPIVMSLSSTIEKSRKDYYNALKDAQRSLDISPWILYFSKTILEAQKNAKRITNFTLNRTKFLDDHKSLLNERQLKVILKMLDQGSDGFEGGMSAKKYDIEYWSPVDQTYREITSCSNCTDFQARNLNIRVRREDGRVETLHTLNGTAISLARTMVAVIENYATAGGKLKVPEALKPYLGNKEEI